MAFRRGERIELSGLSPLSWRLGWLRGLVLSIAIAPVVIAGVSGTWRSWWTLLGGLAFTTLAVAFEWGSRILLVDQGVLLRRYGRDTLVRWEDIEHVQVVQRLGGGPWNTRRPNARSSYWGVFSTVRLTLRDDSVVDLPIDEQQVKIVASSSPLHLGATGTYDVPVKTAEDLAAAIGERVASAGFVEEGTAPMLERLARGARAVGRWRASLESLGSGSDRAAYRDGDASGEALWRVLESPAASRSARAAAAIALRARLDEAGRARIRVARDACASPKLRIALDTVVDPQATDDTLEQALARTSDGEP